MTQAVCPHCGKPLANPEKLGWHLSRECPAFAGVGSSTGASGNGTGKVEHAER